MIRRIPAHAIETVVIAALRAANISTAASSCSSGIESLEPLSEADLVATCLARVTVHPDALQLALIGADVREPIRVPWAPKRVHNRRDIVVPPDTDRAGLRPMKVEDRARILTAIARSRVWVADLIAARVTGTEAIAVREGCSERAVRMMLPLAHLSPRIVRAIVDHRLSRGIVIRHLAELRATWTGQDRAIGL